MRNARRSYERAPLMPIATPAAHPHLAHVTTLLHAARQGDRGAEEALFARVYGDMKRRARAQLAGRRPGGTLDTTSLVNEAYLRLGGASRLDATGRAHFFNLTARVMRNVVVDF